MYVYFTSWLLLSSVDTMGKLYILTLTATSHANPIDILQIQHVCGDEELSCNIALCLQAFFQEYYHEKKTVQG